MGTALPGYAAGRDARVPAQRFYAGIRLGNQIVHLKLVDQPDPSIAFVRKDTRCTSASMSSAIG